MNDFNNNNDRFQGRPSRDYGDFNRGENQMRKYNTDNNERYGRGGPRDSRNDGGYQGRDNRDRSERPYHNNNYQRDNK